MSSSIQQQLGCKFSHSPQVFKAIKCCRSFDLRTHKNNLNLFISKQKSACHLQAVQWWMCPKDHVGFCCVWNSSASLIQYEKHTPWKQKFLVFVCNLCFWAQAYAWEFFSYPVNLQICLTASAAFMNCVFSCIKHPMVKLFKMWSSHLSN